MPTYKSKKDISHHRRGFRQALDYMQQQGFSLQQCLANSDLKIETLYEAELSLDIEQEFQLYRNLLELSQDPLLGLALGRQYSLDSYGLLGYALMSSSSLRNNIELVKDYGALTFSHFHMALCEEDDLAGMAFAPLYTIPDDLLQVYSDRDIQAGLTSQQAVGLQAAPVKIRLMHSDTANRERYQQAFGCPVEFGHHRNELLMEKSLLDQRLPAADIEASNFCRQQCQVLLNKLVRKTAFVEQVRSLIIAKPGSIPSIDKVAQQLCISGRTLRRKLSQEGVNYQSLVNEVRFELAKDYLEAGITVENIATLLAYSEVSNFSHAFKRWAKMSPSEYRRLRV